MLMKNAKFVVNINGTTTWKAVRIGGRRLFWESIGGKTDGGFSRDIAIVKVCQCKIDRQQLNESVYKKSYRWFLYDLDVQYVKEFDQNKNKEELAYLFHYILSLI